jgi:hypothetical protein
MDIKTDLNVEDVQLLTPSNQEVSNISNLDYEGSNQDSEQLINQSDLADFNDLVETLKSGINMNEFVGDLSSSEHSSKNEIQPFEKATKEKEFNTKQIISNDQDS